MFAYAAWRGLEKEFRKFQKASPDLCAQWSSLNGQWIRCTAPEGEEDRFYTLTALVATAAGHRGGDGAVDYLLNLVKQYLLERRSKNITTGQEAEWIKPPGVEVTPPGIKWDDATVRHGATYTIRPLCQALADYCLERARQAHSGDSPPQAVTPKSSPKCRAQNWEEVEILFLSDHRVQVRIAGETYSLNYSEMGFADRRSDKPSQSWGILRVLARADGAIPEAARTGREWVATEKQIERTRKGLQRHFGLSGDPLPYEKGTGYRARFQIGCAASFDQ